MPNLTYSDDDMVAEWVGQHYRVNFDACDADEKDSWRDRYAEAHRGESNTEFVTRVMEFARTGPLMQVFVIQALDQYSKAVSAADPASCDTGLVSGAAWVACAKELQTEIRNHLEK